MPFTITTLHYAFIVRTTSFSFLFLASIDIIEMSQILLHDIRYLRVFIVITTLLSFANLNQLFGNGRERKICTILKRIYALLLLSAVPIFDAYQMYFTATILRRSSSLIFVDTLAQVSLTSFTIATIFNFTFYKRREFSKMLNNILRIDRIFSRYFNLRRRNRRLWFELLLIHIYFSWAYFLEQHLYRLVNKIKYHRYFALQNIEKYFIGVFIVLARHLMKAVRERVTCMNAIIEECNDLKVMNGILIALCDTVNNFNSVFEWSILLFAQYTLISVLLSFTHFVRWYINPPITFHLKHTTFIYFYMTNNALWSLYSMVSINSIFHDSKVIGVRPFYS